MNKRPISITVIAYLLIVMGAVGIVYHFTEYKNSPPAEYVGVLIVRLIAIVCGVNLLRGRYWARWLATAWITFHVVISWFHSLQDVAVHLVVLVVFAVVLFRTAASRYFRPLQ